jgi:uroporphyrinogen decarboxylase
MTSRERLLAVVHGDIPDCVPVAPDISNMIPAKMTGLPFWDLYLYKKIPIWEAYIRAARYFNFDSVMDGYFPLSFPFEKEGQPDWQEYIVFKNHERIVTQRGYKIRGGMHWENKVNAYLIGDPPTRNIEPERLNLPSIPDKFEPVEGVRETDTGPDGFIRVKQLLGNQGLIGVFLTSTVAFANEEGIYRYYDNPELHDQWAQERVEIMEKRFKAIMAMVVKPDFICVGGSGTLVTQTEEMFRKVSFPAVKKAIELCHNAGIPTHIHSCGPESRLVEIMAEETSLTIIDPLEIPPMGDCNLADLKKTVRFQIGTEGKSSYHGNHALWYSSRCNRSL